MGDSWVHLRICLTCGHVGCCDSSKNRHATAHFRATGHPIIQSFQPGEDWGWCYIDLNLYASGRLTSAEAARRAVFSGEQCLAEGAFRAFSVLY